MMINLKRLAKKATVLSTALIAVCTNPSSAQTASAAIINASVTGRVFIITNNGDLKPARLANIYILSANGAGGDSAATIFLKSVTDSLEAETQNLDPYDRARTLSSDEVQCEKTLLLNLQAVAKTMDWAQKNPDATVLASHTDENGEFKVPIKLTRKAGSLMLRASDKKIIGHEWNYMVIAQGQAGANDAYWQADAYITLTNGKIQWTTTESNTPVLGKDVKLKLWKPDKSCLKGAS